MRLPSLILFEVLLASCDAYGKLPDGEQIDGIWVGARGDCESVDPGFCGALFRCAVEVKFGGIDPGIVSWQMHSRPNRLRDGTLLIHGGAVAIVVFDLQGGSRRATYVMETDRCR